MNIVSKEENLLNNVSLNLKQSLAIIFWTGYM